MGAHTTAIKAGERPPNTVLSNLHPRLSSFVTTRSKPFSTATWSGASPVLASNSQISLGPQLPPPDSMASTSFSHAEAVCSTSINRFLLP